MRFASTAVQMRELDRRVIEGLGLPGVALMELAARGVADVVRAHHATDATRGVTIVCGPGNNGGDGWAVARWLRAHGVAVSVWSVGEPRSGTDAAIMRNVARAMGIREVQGVDGAGLVIDAVFGTGLVRDVEEPYAGAIAKIDRCGAPVVAIDVPSGLESDTGRVLGRCATAVRTVTFGRPKLGMYLGEGPDLCGEIHVVDIGLEAGTPSDVQAAAEIPDWSDLAPRWPVRRASDHKNSVGHLLVVAGSAAMTGAAILVCRGALAAGIGLVTLVATRSMRARLAGAPPEVMLLDGGEGETLMSLPDLARYDAVAVGPGLGGGHPLPLGLRDALAEQWATDSRPWIADADALPITGPSSAPRVLTPHPGEAARLLGGTAAYVQADRLGSAQRLATRGTVLLKGRFTVIAAEGWRPSLNPTGSPALATGGTGDVLTGVIGALLARGVPPRDAARLAAFVHGRAGERLSAQRADGWTASDVASEISAAAAERP